jgi:DNA-binding MarR family transcriptional regulator
LARSLDADGLVKRTRDPVDTRTVRLSLTDRGRAVVEPAIAEVRVLLDRLLAPLGGRDDARTKAFVRDLSALLEADLD